MSLIPPHQPDPLGPLYGHEHACTGPQLTPPDTPSSPTQEDMDKLASALTEVVLLLRAGDMEGARGVLIDASGMCDIKIFGRNPLSTVPDHYLDAVRYGAGIYKSMQAPLPPAPPTQLTATETLHRQKEAKRIHDARLDARLDAIQDAMATNLLKTIAGMY